MASTYVSRRAFIGTIATATGTASLTGFVPSPLSAQTSQNELPGTDREIKVVSLQKFSEKDQERIRAASKNIHLEIAADQNSAALNDAEVIIGDPEANTIRNAKNLKWVQVMHAGVENMPKEMIAHPLVLTNMQKVLAPVIAETAISLLLSLTRGLTQFAFPNFMQRKWAYNPPADVVLDDLYQKTIGIVGLGGIGSETARRLHYGFNMHVLATDAKPIHKPEYVDELHDPSWFMEMVPKVDVLMSAAPLTKETREMFNDEVFRRMKPSAYFINVSRGGLVKQDALVDALKNKRIRGAGLDVATPEPLPANDPLWTCSNVALTAHNSSNAPVRAERVLALLTENLRRYANGLPLMNVVDKVAGY
jgi:phosphoglycerate dehydrogenase-like enzyme